MRKLSLRLIIFAVVLQPLLDFLIGQRLEIPFLGYHWRILEFITIFAFGSLLLTYPQYKGTVFSPPPMIIAGFTITLLSILAGVYEGLNRGFYSTLSDARPLFIVGSLSLFSFLIIQSSEELYIVKYTLRKGALLIAALSIAYGFSNLIIGESPFGYIHYDALFLVAFGATTYMCESTKERPLNQLFFGFTFFFVALLVNLNKAILSSLFLSLPAIFWLIAQCSDLSYTYLNVKKPRLTLLFGCSLGIILLANILFPETIGGYFLQFWRDRVLHGSEFTDFDLESLTGGRASLWEQTIFWLNQDPWLGQGIGFRLSKVLPRELEEVEVGFSSHNEYLYLLTALGIPTFLISGVTFISYLRIIAKGFRHQVLPHQLKQALLSFWGFIWCMVAFGLVGLWNISSVGASLFGLSLGLTLRLVLQAEQQTHDTSGVEL